MLKFVELSLVKNYPFALKIMWNSLL